MAITIEDLSERPRLGFKGRGTVEAMKRRSVTVEATPNRAFRQADGSLCLVLAPGEVFYLSNEAGDGSRLAQWEQGWRIEDEERSYPLPRRDSHAWFRLTGTDLPAMMAKICGVDLRHDRFGDLAIAQTSVARLNAIVLRADREGAPAFHLRDAAEEFGGRIADLAEPRSHARR
jgi:sarcosine oxidase subunit gamma